MYRMIASDMDDTMLNHEGKLTERSEKALKDAMAAGAKVVLASGRMHEAIEKYARRVGVNAPVVSYNGAMIYDMVNDRPLSTQSIPMDTAKAIAKMAEDRGIYVQTYPGKGYFTEKKTPYTEAYEKSIGVICTETGVKLSQWISSDVIKLLFICDKKDTPGIIETFSREFPDVTFMMSRPHYVEIVSKGISKAAAIEIILEHLGIAPQELVAFGDGQNDLEMLHLAGLGYCMANALESVRSQCGRIAPSNAEDGCAQIIEGLLSAGELGGA